MRKMVNFVRHDSIVAALGLSLIDLNRRGRRRLIPALFAAVVVTWAAIPQACNAHAGHEPSIAWLRQLSTSDLGTGVGIDDLGNVYITGYGLVDPVTNENDAYVDKYDAAGNHLWTRTIATTEDDQSHDISVTGAGGFYITGQTLGDLYATHAGGGKEAVLGSYNSAGNLIWGRHLSTAGDIVSNAVSADNLGNIFLGGFSSGPVNGDYGGGLSDGFVAKYDVAGNLMWSRNIGTDEPDWVNDVSADGAGNVYVAGETRGVLDADGAAGNFDSYLRKYDSAGNVLWTRQIGTLTDETNSSVSTDALGNVFIGGATGGSMGDESAGLSDVFIQKHDADGNHLWTRQFGTEALDAIFAIQTDGLGNVYIAGETAGDLGAVNAGAVDVLVAKLDTEGNVLWINQFGSVHSDQIWGLALKEPGTLFLAGNTGGVLEGTEVELTDAILVKLVDEVPEPATAVMSILAAISILSGLRRRRAG